MKIKLNNQTWDVVIKHQQETSLEKAWGYCNPVAQEIAVSSYLSKERMIEVFIHELTHAIVFSFLIEEKKNYSEEDMANFIKKYYYIYWNAIEEFKEMLR